MDRAKVLFAIGIVVLAAWLGFSIFVAFLSPLYTVGGVDTGWWLVGFHWFGVLVAGAATLLALWLRKSRLPVATAIAWLTAPMSYAAWLGFYEFYNAVLSRSGGVSVPV